MLSVIVFSLPCVYCVICDVTYTCMTVVFAIGSVQHRRYCEYLSGLVVLSTLPTSRMYQVHAQYHVYPAVSHIFILYHRLYYIFMPPFELDDPVLLAKTNIDIHVHVPVGESVCRKVYLKSFLSKYM